MGKGQPFSVRLDEQTERLVEVEARRTSRSKSAVVAALTEEAARTRRFPGLAFRGDDARRRAWVIGSGLDVWEICHMADDFGSSEAMVAATQVTASQARLADAYRGAYGEEIDRLIEDNNRSIDELTALYPFVDVSGV